MRRLALCRNMRKLAEWIGAIASGKRESPRESGYSTKSMPSFAPPQKESCVKHKNKHVQSLRPFRPSDGRSKLRGAEQHKGQEAGRFIPPESGLAVASVFSMCCPFALVFWLCFRVLWCFFLLVSVVWRCRFRVFLFLPLFSEVWFRFGAFWFLSSFCCDLVVLFRCFLLFFFSLFRSFPFFSSSFCNGITF